MSQKQNGVDEHLDLRGVLCPYNYVKTKIKLEAMEIGQLLSVIVDEGEPVLNVPRSVSQDGHTIVGQEPFEDGYQVLIKKQV